MSVPQKGSLQLRLSAAASPERVFVAVAMFRDMLRVINPHLPDDSITLVVSNFDMTAGLRPHDASGQASVDALVRFLSKPVKEANRRVALAGVADVITHYSPKLAPYGAAFWTPRKLLCTVDDQLDAVMRRVATGKARRLMRGDTTVYSPVYRVGRTDDQSAFVKARLAINDRTRDLAILRGKEEGFFEAAKRGKICRVRVEAFWYRDEEGELELYAPKTRLISVEELTPVSGADVMQAVQDYPFQIFDNVEDVIDDLQET